MALRPEAGSRGLASADPTDALRLVKAAYLGAADLARRLDLDVPSRCRGWSRRDVLVHLGAWDEHRVFDRLLDDARRGRIHDVDDPDGRNALVVAAHQDASGEDVAQALERAAARAEAFLTSAEADTLGRRFCNSPVGPLPVTGILVASAYEVAVHTLDVASREEIPPDLLDAGVAALVDTTGALVARHELNATFSVRTPQGTWACGSAGRDWTTIQLAAEVDTQPGWPGVHGHAADVLEAASGRANATQLLVSRRLHVHDMPALVALLPALESVPGIAGGLAARAALRTLGQTGRLVGHLSRFRWTGDAAVR